MGKRRWVRRVNEGSLGFAADLKFLEGGEEPGKELQQSQVRETGLGSNGMDTHSHPLFKDSVSQSLPLVTGPVRLNKMLLCDVCMYLPTAMW